MSRPHRAIPDRHRHLQFSKSQIVWRRLSRDRVSLDEAYLRGALEKRAGAADRRCGPDFRRRAGVWSGASPTTCPAWWSDQFGDTRWSCRSRRSRWRSAAALISDLLAELPAAGSQEIIFRNDAPISVSSRVLPAGVHTRSGSAWEPRWVKIDGLDYWLDLQGRVRRRDFTSTSGQQHAVGGEILPRAGACSTPFATRASFALHCRARRRGRVWSVFDSAFDAVAAGEEERRPQRA